MKIYIGDKLYEFTDEELDYMYIDEGNEAIVYRKNDKALKIYKEYCYKDRLNEATAEDLSNIKTRRLLLPEKMIHLIDGKFKGYTTTFIQGYLLSHMNEMLMRDFMKEISIYDEDIEILSDEHILIADLIRENIKYDSRIYNVDPGSYYKLPKVDKAKIIRNNQEALNMFVVGHIFYAIPKLSREKKEKLVNHFQGIDKISRVMKEEAKEDEKVKEYVKRICA